MAGASKEVVVQDANEAALREFEEGLARSIKQYKAEEVKRRSRASRLKKSS